MHKKSKDPDKKIADVRYRRQGQVRRNLEQPFEESPETLEKAVGTGKRLGSERVIKKRGSDNRKP